MKLLGVWIRLKHALLEGGVDEFIHEIKTRVVPLTLFLYFVKKYKDKFLRKTRTKLYKNEVICQLDYIVVFKDNRMYIVTPFGFVNVRHKRKNRLSKGLKNVC